MYIGKEMVPTIRSATARFTRKKFPNFLKRRDFLKTAMAATLLTMMAIAMIAYVTHHVITLLSTLVDVELLVIDVLFIFYKEMDIQWAFTSYRKAQ